VREAGDIAVAGDSTACLDPCGYRRYCLSKFAWILKPPPGVFFKERLKENDEWLWDIFEFLKWYRYSWC
jgi:hypothetical protein